MPEPLKADRRYMPGLDGLRAVAVLGVVAYHLGIGALPGGFLGVSVFFTLSGYLISDLILGRTAAGEFTLRSFWMARARRLLPAMLLMLVALMAWVTVLGPRQNSDLRAAAGTSSIYINNWWQVFRKISYFAQFDTPGALNHLWSLAIEEQFYIVWPLLLLVLARFVRESHQRVTRPRLGLCILGLATLSTVLMAVLFHPGSDPTRVYYGTDTRASELLVGAALAAVWPSEHLRLPVRAGARNMIDAAGAIGLLVIAIMFLTLGDTASFLYRGGFALLSLTTAVVVASLAHPASRIGPLLGCRPMRWVGARSYGIYLWHFPVIILSTPDGSVGPHPVRTPLQILVSFCLAALSWRFVEDPIRRGAIGRLREQWLGPHRARLFDPSPGRVVAVCVASLLLIPAVAGAAGVGVRGDSETAGLELEITETVDGSEQGEPGTTDVTPGKPTTTVLVTTPSDSTRPTDPVVSERSTTTACTEIVHIGDSTSTGLIGKKYLRTADAIPAQYTRVGAVLQHYEIAGGRSINEGYRKARPAKRSAETWQKKGFSGCWVLALGTMDSAAVGKGIKPGIRARIKMMMDIVGDDPVMWVNLKGRRSGGPWGAQSLAAWNSALAETCAEHPNMRIYDWADDVKPSWYISDGIHQNSEGYKYRARFIADALAQAFPAATPGTPIHGCVIRI